ncbi:MAG: ABC transporter permease [Ruminiclostridium sp.]
MTGLTSNSTGITVGGNNNSPMERFKQLSSKFYMVYVLIGVIIIGAVSSDSFLSLYNMQGFMITIAIYGFLALGQAMVMFVSEINMTLGVQMAFAPIASMWLTKIIFEANGRTFIVGNIYIVDGIGYMLVFTLIFGILIGFINGLIRVKFNVPSLIITLGMMYVLAGGCYVLAGQYNMFLSRIKGVNVLGSGKIGIFPICFVIFIAFGLLFMFLMKYTKMGNRLLATGGNEKAAIYSGINTKFWKVLCFTLSGLFASIAAIIYSSRMESIDPLQGSGLLYCTIAIAVIGGVSMTGGTGTILGTILGAASLAIAVNIMQMTSVASWYQTIIVGLIIIIAAIQQSKALQKSNRVIPIKV